MTFVVAEIGINWDGNLNLAKEMIKKAKQVGCDAVKFQAFNLDIVKEHPQSERLLKSSISRDNIKKITSFAKEENIEWFCTPMFVNAIEILEPFVKRYKIREVDGRKLLQNQTTEIFEKILETGKEIIVSSNSSPKNSKFYKNKNIKWLYCVPKYPTVVSDLDFSQIKDFDGFSNHSSDILIPVISTILGSEIIEIHVTLDKHKDFIDNNVSLDFDEMKELVRQIRIVDSISK